MRKISISMLCVISLCACSKHDPILPGTRTAIFSENEINLLNTTITDLDDSAIAIEVQDCPYTQDSSNTIRYGDTKIFCGFPMANCVENDQKPVCVGKYVYAGLTTGNVVKIDSNNKKVVWMTDVYKESNMTGGAPVVDIIAPIIINKGWLYVGGMGDAFCKINATSGNKKWCAQIGTTNEFVLTKNAIFVVGMDNNLYALRESDGAVYWKREIKKQKAPKYENKVISVGKQKFNATTGTEI